MPPADDSRRSGQSVALTSAITTTGLADDRRDRAADVAALP
jgi:hypothetical protein